METRTDSTTRDDQQRHDATKVAVWNRITGRAWSRAGAVAAVLSDHPVRRLGTFSARLAMLVFGSLAISVSVAVTLWTELGPGPLDVFIGAVSDLTGLPLAVGVWLTVGSVIAVAFVMGRRPGIGTFVSPFLIGPMLQTAVSVLDSFDVPDLVVVRLVLQVAAVFGIGLGSGALITSGLGAGSGELFAGAASDRVGLSEPRVRFGIEMFWIAAGVLLGGPAGLGTVIVAVTVGPAVALGYRWVWAAWCRAWGSAASHEDAAETVTDEADELVSV